MNGGSSQVLGCVCVNALFCNVWNKKTVYACRLWINVYFCKRLSWPVRVGGWHFGFNCSVPYVGNCCCWKKDVYGRYLRRTNLANLNHSRRYGNGTSTLGVLYPVVTEQSGAVLRIICHDVGWLRCLSLSGGNARACTWDEREVGTPTSFLYPYPNSLFIC